MPGAQVRDSGQHSACQIKGCSSAKNLLFYWTSAKDLLALEDGSRDVGQET